MKKGELQTYESILVIFFFMFIFFIGFVFFYRFTLEDIRSDVLSYEDFKFKQLLGLVPSMYEFRCSFSLSDDECVDISKVISFDRVSKDYFDVFGYKKISITIVYPEEENEIIIYEKIPKVYKTKKEISSPISVYSNKDDRYKIGRLSIEWYY